MNLFGGLRNMIDIKADKAQITKITQTGEKTIILEKDSLSLLDINNHLNIIQPDDNMLKHVFLTFELENSENEKICLKKFLVQYKDFNEEYSHTIENILLFNDIESNENSMINVKMFKNIKMINLKIPIIDVRDKHINYFNNL